MLQVWLYQWQEFGGTLAAMQAYILETMFCVIAIACAFDFTFQFAWLDPDIVLDGQDPRFSTNINTTFLN